MVTTIEPGVTYSFSLKSKKEVALLDSFLKALNVNITKEAQENENRMSKEAYYNLMEQSMKSFDESKAIRGEKAILEQLNALK
jgi:hypothetical protein